MSVLDADVDELDVDADASVDVFGGSLLLAFIFLFRGWSSTEFWIVLDVELLDCVGCCCCCEEEDCWCKLHCEELNCKEFEIDAVTAAVIVCPVCELVGFTF